MWRTLSVHIAWWCMWVHVLTERNAMRLQVPYCDLVLVMYLPYVTHCIDMNGPASAAPITLISEPRSTFRASKDDSEALWWWGEYIANRLNVDCKPATSYLVAGFLLSLFLLAVMAEALRAFLAVMAECVSSCGWVHDRYMCTLLLHPVCLLLLRWFWQLCIRMICFGPCR